MCSRFVERERGVWVGIEVNMYIQRGKWANIHSIVYYILNPFWRLLSSKLPMRLIPLSQHWWGLEIDIPNEVANFKLTLQAWNKLEWCEINSSTFWLEIWWWSQCCACNLIGYIHWKLFDSQPHGHKKTNFGSPVLNFVSWFLAS